MDNLVDLAKLTKAFPAEAIKQRKASDGKSLSYVAGHTVIHRLNDAAPSWTFVIQNLSTSVIGKDKDGLDVVLIQAHVALTLPGLGTREHIGVQSVYARSGEDLYKGAITDALKKAATLFGVGLELYGPDYEDDHAAAPIVESPIDFASTRGRRMDGQTTGHTGTTNGNGNHATTDRLVTPRQQQFIQAIAREKGMSDDDLNAEIERAYGRATVAELDRRDASAFIDRLQSRRPATEVAT